MLSRPHPLHPHGAYLYLAPGDWRHCLEKQITFRDAHLIEHPHYSGVVPAFARWVNEVQLPQLAANPWYRRQFSDRLERRRVDLERVMASISDGHAYKQAESDQISAEIAQLEELLSND